MGNYLDSPDALTAYTAVYNSPYFIDKSAILNEIIPRMKTTEKYICITRPRRFGKSVAANMITAFFSRGSASREIFDCLDIAGSPFYADHINQHPVISISFNRLPRRCDNYDQYISRIERKLMDDLTAIYPHVKLVYRPIYI
jgi:hypothetical protein